MVTEGGKPRIAPGDRRETAGKPQGTWGSWILNLVLEEGEFYFRYRSSKEIPASFSNRLNSSMNDSKWYHRDVNEIAWMLHIQPASQKNSEIYFLSWSRHYCLSSYPESGSQDIQWNEDWSTDEYGPPHHQSGRGGIFCFSKYPRCNWTVPFFDPFLKLLAVPSLNRWCDNIFACKTRIHSLNWPSSRTDNMVHYYPGVPNGHPGLFKVCLLRRQCY